MASINKVKGAPGTKCWLAQVNVKGQSRTSRRFMTEREAKEWAEPLERELTRMRDGGARPDMSKLTIKDLAEEYLDDPTTQSLKAYDDRARGVDWWVSQYGSTRLMQFNVSTILDARKRLMPGRAHASVNRYLAAMRGAWNWGLTTGFVRPEQVWPNRMMLTEPKGRTRYLTDDEIDRILKASKTQGSMMYAAVLVSIACGMRKGELLRLKWSDVDFDNSTLRLLLTKNGQSRAVYLPPNATTALKAIKQQTVVSLDAWVFVDDEGKQIGQGWIEYRWRSVIKDSKLKDFRWHDLRHSCASLLAQSGASLPEIGSVLGHQSPQATWRYSHLVQGKAVKGHVELDAKLGGK